MYFLHYTHCIESKNIMLREFLAADVQRIIGIRPIRTMLQQVLFRLSQLLPGLLLLEAIPSPADPSHLYGQNEVLIVLPVEERHEALFPSKRLVDEQVLLAVLHRIPEIHIHHVPSMPLELVADEPVEILVIDRVVCPQCRTVVVEYHSLVLVEMVVRAEILDERRYLPFVLHEERLQHILPPSRGLSSQNSVDVGVVVHPDADRPTPVTVTVSP